ncbi:hypothetical protein [Microbulbifer sp. VAAF005]|uniref:hypothetical protein n=1 Tax=Microbulbifer sp. VAAF005 TaxID=3034230 RepID=UPI0024AE0474|nr:hypothetical protein [Microbulbifer sp. VAAF005]WHI46818.1 hypothetical protein P0078_00130 [Microbulbifer sp. VAAF005]
MQLHKRLTVNGEPVSIINDDVRLDLFTPGRAAFTVRSSANLNGLVQLDLGYNPNQLQRFFIGYVVNCTTVNGDQKLMCRELTAALAKVVPLAERYITLAGVLGVISSLTGLQFVIGTGSYTDNKAPAFYSMGTGYWVMDHLGQAFDIPQYTWQQQGDGKVFVGSWADSYWAGRPLALPSGYTTNFGISNRAKIACIPRLRPGVLLNGHYATKVELSGNYMNLTWSADPWTSK